MDHIGQQNGTIPTGQNHGSATRAITQENDTLSIVRKRFPELSAEDAFAPLRWYFDQRSWTENSLTPGNIPHNYPVPVRIRGALNQQVLERSLREVLRRQSALRSIFRIVDGELLQIIVPLQPHPLPVVDLSGLSEVDIESRARVIAHEDANQPFDLTRGPVFRASLLRLGAEDHVLLLTTHHVVCDEWSTGILARELCALYGALAAGHSSPLPEVSYQYGDFVRWLKKRLQGRELESRLAFWKNRLAGENNFHHVPVDHPRPPERSYRGRHESVVFPEELNMRIGTLSRCAQVSPFMTMFAAFQCLLHRYSGHEDIGVGTCVANRALVKIDGLIGPFGNVVVLRGDLSGNPTFREVLGRVREQSLIAFSCQDLPFGTMLDHLRPNHDPSRNPLFQVLFVMQNALGESRPIPGLTLEPYTLDTGTTRYELNVWLKVCGGLEVDIQYNSDLFEAATIRQILKDYREILEAMVENPELRIADLKIATQRASSNGQLGCTIQDGPAKSRDVVESQLVELWQEVLGKMPIGIKDNYFELGGDSLKAARLFAQINHAFRIKLPLSTLFKAATIEELAKFVRKEQASPSEWSVLVPVQPDGHRPALFCPHGLYGEVLFCGDLAGQLGADQPVFGLQARGLDGQAAHVTIPEMAADYLNEVRTVQPDGPYYLCGYCFGGLVAFEMAQQLHAAGQEVRFLGLINTPMPSTLWPGPLQRARDLAERTIINLRKFTKLGTKKKISYLRDRYRIVTERSIGRVKTEALRVACRFSQRSDRSLFQRFLSVPEMHLEAAKNYRPQAYSGRVVFFLSEESPRMLRAHSIAGWNALAEGGVEVHTMPGDDESVLEKPFGLVLTEKLNLCLHNAQVGKSWSVQTGR